MPRHSLPIILLSLLFPFAASAAVADELRTPDASVVSRGEFIRAAVRVLEIAPETGGTDYLRVPKALAPYVNAAAERSALEIFGADLGPARGITRGEALAVLAALEDRSARMTESFRDVPEDSGLRRGVAVALDRDWMEPLRRNLFGVDRMLTGKDARVLLRKVIGEAEPVAVPDHPGTVTITLPGKLPSHSPSSALPKEDLFKTVWKLLVDQYVRQEKLDPEEAAYRALEAMVGSLGDPYTSFLRPISNREFQSQLEGEIVGIGVQVEQKDGKLTVISPLQGSPADQAGLKPGDVILSVNGESLEGMSLLEAVSKVRGKEGTIADLVIDRDGQQYPFSVKRQVISIPEIEVSTQGTVAVVKLLQFGERSQREFRRTMEGIQKSAPTGIILDLRNNPGGLLDAADIVLSNFLPDRSVTALIASRNETYEERTTGEQTVDEDIPLVVLINNGSASASEIVAGALQDAGRAIVLGEKSYGKGTVQQIIEFDDGSSLKMTIAEWLTPEGRKIDGVGIQPDVVVEMQEGDRDEQMLKALELLR